MLNVDKLLSFVSDRLDTALADARYCLTAFSEAGTRVELYRLVSSLHLVSLALSDLEVVCEHYNEWLQEVDDRLRVQEERYTELLYKLADK